MKTLFTWSVSSLLCLASVTVYAAQTTSDAPKAEADEPAKAGSPARNATNEMLGITLVADVDLSHIDRFRTLGMRRGFGNDEPLCDFIATEKWVSKRGTSIKAGAKLKIGKVTVVEATDGFGNTGTKLILNSTEPEEGLVFYCYAFNSREKAYWAIDKKQLKKALSGVFHIEDQPR